MADIALPVWPVNTDYSTHPDVVDHAHACPTCGTVARCSNAVLGDTCQAVEWFAHGEYQCTIGAPATQADLDSLAQHLHMIAPGYRAQAVEAIPTT